MRNKKTLSILACFILIIVIVMAGCGGGDNNNAGGSSSNDIDPNQTWNLTLSEQIPETQHLAELEAIAFANIKERTNGQVNITGYYNNSLLEGSNQYSGVAQGMADFCFYQIDANTGSQILCPVFSLPVIGNRPTPDKIRPVYQEFFETHPEFQEENHKSGIHVVMVSSNPPTILHGVEKVVNTPQDMNGMKIISTARYAPMINAFGSSIQMPVSEYYSSLEKGVAQGQYTHFSAAHVFGTLELLKTHTFSGDTISSGFGNQGYTYIANLETWETLPEEYQDIITEELIRCTAQSVLNDMEDVENYSKEAIDRGDAMVYLSSAEDQAPWRDAAQLSVEAWLSDCEAAGYNKADCQKLYDDLQVAVAAISH